MRRYSLAVLSLALLAAPAAGQVIPIRTAPLVRADGFEVLPSRQLDMGGASIATGDTLGDPWGNPAMAARVTGTRIFGSPVAFSVSGAGGGGGALPIGVIARPGTWFGAGALAIQTLHPADSRDFGFERLDSAEGEDDPRGSAYGFALLGRSWSERGLSIGASVLAARRGRTDGTRLLYAESDGVASSGAEAAFRLGVLREWSGARSLKAVAVHTRTRMTHDVRYTDFFWDPATQQPLPDARAERHAEEADMWGLHVVHARPLTRSWRIGLVATANLVTQPMIPRYDQPRNGISNLAGAEGEAHAYNVGLGVARDGGPVELAADLLYEPIWSRIEGEDRFGATIENRVRFSNAVLRGGLARAWALDDDGSSVEARLGVATRLVDYRIEQVDVLSGSERAHEDWWVEWTPTWGGSFRLENVEFQYHGSIAYGTNRPGGGADSFVRPCEVCAFADLTLGGPGPTARRAPGEVQVVTQQFVISIPVGATRREGGAR